MPQAPGTVGPTPGGYNPRAPMSSVSGMVSMQAAASTVTKSLYWQPPKGLVPGPLCESAASGAVSPAVHERQTGRSCR
jgi:hypothetical protein